jgi:hypothetical protein
LVSKILNIVKHLTFEPKLYYFWVIRSLEMKRSTKVLAAGALFVGGLAGCGPDGPAEHGGGGHDMDSHAATVEQGDSAETTAFDNFIEEHGTRLFPTDSTDTDLTLPGVPAPAEGAHAMHGSDVKHIVLEDGSGLQNIDLDDGTRAHLSIPDGARGRIGLGGAEVVRVAFLDDEGGYNTLQGQAAELFNPVGDHTILEAFVRVEEITVQLPR